MEYGRVQISSLTGIQNVELNAQLCKGIETLGGNVKPVIVVKEGYNQERGDFSYRVVANHDVAVAAKGYHSVNPRFEYVNCFVVPAELAQVAAKQFS